ncbi:transposase [Malonomonas rubra]|uniref:RNA-guided endonuclease InsQ/TnpB family protein n=1 Tax=Malonomonas rubra TaxID=57040 RepID=UPI0026F02CDA|nr:transposase [Malonomonas rubra]
MIKLKAYKFRLKLTPTQEWQCRNFAGQVRFVWNKGLSLQKERLSRNEKTLGYVKLCSELTRWRNSEETEFLAEGPNHTQQQKLKDLNLALKDAFDKSQPNKRFPVTKKKGKCRDSFRFPDPEQFEVDFGHRQIKLPKLGWIRLQKTSKRQKKRLKIEGTPKQITVTRKGEFWFASIQVEIETEDVVHASTTAVGGDLGVAKFLALSDGTIYDSINSFKKLQKRLAREQQKFARMVKFSKNWKKQQKKIARIHEKIANCRHDHIHKISDEISKNHAVVVLEDLRIINMSKSAKGDQENPGKNVKAKSGLNRSILDQGWGMFRELVEYKQKWRGGQLVLIPPMFTSQECSACHHVSKNNRKTQSLFICEACGHTKDADLNAAENIYAAGHAVYASS